MSLEMYNRKAKKDNYFSQPKYIYKIENTSFYFSFSSSGKQLNINYIINHGKPLTTSGYKKILSEILRIMNKVGATTITYLPRNKKFDSFMEKHLNAQKDLFLHLFPTGLKNITKDALEMMLKQK